MQPTDPFSPVKLTIGFIDGAAGSGKTRKGGKHFESRARRGEKILFVVPTVRLINEIYDYLRDELKSKVKIVRLHYRTVTRVGNEICDLIEKNDVGCIVLITHKAFFELPDWPIGRANTGWLWTRYPISFSLRHRLS